MILQHQNFKICLRGWNVATNILSAGFLKRMAGVFLMMLFLFTFTGCIMMPFHMASLVDQSGEVDVDSRLHVALNNLIQEGVYELDANSGSYDQILIGQASVRDNFILPEKFRLALVETLRSNNKFQVLTQNEPAESVRRETETTGAIAVLDAQLYKTGDQIWLAFQLIDVRSHRIFWSGIFSEPVPKALNEIEKTDEFLTVGS